MKSKIYTESIILITGKAKPSSEDAINAMYKTFSLCLYIDTDDDKIVDIACTTIMDETEEFIRQIMYGHNIVSDLDAIIETLHKRFYALVQKTLIVALKDAQNRYFMIYPHKRSMEIK